MIEVKDGGAVEFTRPDWLIADNTARAVSQLMTGTRAEWIRAVIGPFRSWYGSAQTAGELSSRAVGQAPLIAPSQRELETVFSKRTGADPWGMWPCNLFEARVTNGPAPNLYARGLRHHRDAALRGGIAVEGWGPITGAALEPPPRSNRSGVMSLAEDLVLLALRDGVAFVHGVSPGRVGVSTLRPVPIGSLIDVAIDDDYRTSRFEMLLAPDPEAPEHSRALVYEWLDGVVTEVIYVSEQKDPDFRLDRMRPANEPITGRPEIPVVPVYAGGRRRPWSAAPPLFAAADAEVHLIDIATRGEAAASLAPKVFLAGAGQDPPPVLWDTIMLPPDAKVTPWQADASVVAALAERSRVLADDLMAMMMIDADVTPARAVDTRTATEARARSAKAGAFIARLGRSLETALQAIAEIAAEANGEPPGTITVGYERAEAAALGDINADEAEIDREEGSRQAASQSSAAIAERLLEWERAEQEEGRR